MFVQSLPRLAQRPIAIVMALLARSLQPILSIAGDKPHIPFISVDDLLLGICFFNPAALPPRIAPGWRGCSDCYDGLLAR